MIVEPWADMSGAPMAGEFYGVCERLDPEIVSLHRMVALDSFEALLGDKVSAEVFLLAVEGQIGDKPDVRELEARICLLIRRFCL
jgi:hypothetical protein